MPNISNIYKFKTYNYRDRVYADIDQSNIQTVENQLAALMTIIGSGVNTGWDVTFMGLTGNNSVDSYTIQQRVIMFDAFLNSPTSWLGNQWTSLGGNSQLLVLDGDNPQYDSNGIPIWNENVWNLVVQVSPGTGILAPYAAQTTLTYYFIYPSSAGFYYVWAVPTASITDGVARIISPPEPVENYDSLHTAVFLAQVEVIELFDAEDVPTGYYSIQMPIIYAPRRQELANLSGALQADLKALLVGHVHTGVPGEPSQINLSTELILNASAPTGSTIFLLYDSSGNAWSGNPLSYGPPVVKLNDVILTDATSYNLNLSSGKISLTNSLEPGSVLQVILPLSPQVVLTLTSTSDINNTQGIVYLTDGTTTTDSNNNIIDVIYTWDTTVWDFGIVQMLVDSTWQTLNPTTYILNASNGSLTFNTPFIGQTNSNFRVIVTKLGIQITGLLSGSNIGSIDASTFVMGQLALSRMVGRDHVGETRYQNPASLQPSTRLFADGDHYTYYPEIIGSDLQYGTDISTIAISANLVTQGNIVLGTKRGMMQTPNLTNKVISLQNTWNVDNGEIISVTDELHPATGENHFGTSYVLTVLNQLYYTASGGASFSELTLPQVALNNNTSQSVNALSFFPGDYFVPLYDPGGIQIGETWYRSLYMGTDYGVWTTNPQEGLPPSVWSWNSSSFWQRNPQSITSINNLGTTHIVTTSSDETGDSSTVTTYDFTYYGGLPWGLMMNVDAGGFACVTCQPVVGFDIMHSGFDVPSTFANIHNNIIWWTEHSVYMTHSAWHINYTIDDGVNTASDDYWAPPLKDIATAQGTVSARVATVATVNIPIINSASVSALDSYTLQNNDMVLLSNQTTTAQNGVYKVNTISPSTSWVKVITEPASVQVVNGTKYATSTWTSSGSVWTIEFPNYIVDVAANGNIINPSDLSHWPPVGYSPVIDGVSGYSLVLLPFQTDSSQNGIYSVSGGGNWTLITPSTPLTTSQWIRVSGGNLYDESVWRVFGTHDIQIAQQLLPTDQLTTLTTTYTATLYLSRIILDLTNSFNSYTNRLNFSEYWVTCSAGAYRCTDAVDANGMWHNPTIHAPTWDSDVQGMSKQLVYNAYSAPYESYIMSSNRGLWLGTLSDSTDPDFTLNWSRTNNIFTYDDVNNNIGVPRPTLYNQFDLSTVDSSTFSVNAAGQEFIFNSEQLVDANFICEKDYVNYYVKPWLDTGSIPATNGSATISTQTVVLIIDSVHGQTIFVPYTLTPNLGQIHFLQSLNISDNVYITIVREGAYISDVGTNPHMEIPESFIVQGTPATTLAQELKPTDTTIYVNNPLALSGCNYIEIVNGTFSERIAINYNTVTNTITTAVSTRNGLDFPGSPNISDNPSQVFIVQGGTQEGLEDLISLATTGQTYHFNSLTGDNILQLAINLNNAVPGLFVDALDNPTPLDNTLLFEFTDSNIDKTNSSSTKWVGLEPTSIDSPIDPSIVYAIYNPVSSGIGMLVGTDHGIWTWDGNKWQQESSLNEATRVYYIKARDASVIAGTDSGIFIRTAGVWTLDPIFPQTSYDYTDASESLISPISWGGFKAYGKSDGFAFDLISSTLASDHFDPLDGVNVYDTYYGQWLTSADDGSGGTTFTKHDGLYLSTPIGLFGLASGNRGGSYSAIFQGRNMIDPSQFLISNPNNPSEQVPVKFYKVFQSLNSTLTHIIILTNNGVYFSLDWRWEDPTDITTGTITVYGPYLPGLSAQCEVQYLDGLGNYWILLGTNAGAFRTNNNGRGPWDVCERIGLGSAVYDLQLGPDTGYDFRSSTSNNQLIFAATDSGLYYTANNGDDWIQPSIHDDNANFPADITGGLYFVNLSTDADEYLAQVFTVDSGVTQLNKIGLYVSLKPGLISPQNYLNISIYEVTLSGDYFIPTGSPLTNTNIDNPYLYASQVLYPGFWNIPITVAVTSGTTYALVVNEVKVDLEPEFRWHHSANTLNNYNSTNGYMLTGGPSAWVRDNTDVSRDFFFKVYEQASPLAIYNAVPSDFSIGTKNGLVVNDNGYLTTDFKIISACVVDDSQSMIWSDTLNGVSRENGIADLLTDIWGRTNTNVLHTTVTSASFVIAAGDTTISVINSHGFSIGQDVLITDGSHINHYLISNIPNTTALVITSNPHGGDTSLSGTMASDSSITYSYSYSESYADFWIYQSNSIERTVGYTNSLADLNTDAHALQNTGLASDIYGTSLIAASGLAPESLIASVFDDTQPISVINSNVQKIADYLNTKGILCLDSLVIPYWESLPSGGRSPWDQTLNSIGLQASYSLTPDGNVNQTDVAWYVVNLWANSFVPVVFIASDGDNSNYLNSPQNVAIAAQGAYYGAAIYSFGLGRSHTESGLRIMSDMSTGKHLDISNAPDDWTQAANTFLHGGNNSLFTGSWAKNYDFSELIWVDNVTAVFDIPSTPGGSIAPVCTIQYRYTINRIVWTDWIVIAASDSGIPQIIQENILGLQMEIVLGDGWNVSDSTPIQPIVNSYIYNWVTPGIQYRYTPVQTIQDGCLSEYILSASADIPPTSRVNWGIVRGNSVDFADYEPALNRRKGILPNRQASVYFTKEPPPVVSTNITNPSGDLTTWKITDANLLPITWNSSSTVVVAQITNLNPNGQTISPINYKLDNVNGLIIFNNAIPASSALQITITQPSVEKYLVGELTITYDNRTYYLANGSWPSDSSIVVLVNNIIMRGGFFESPNEGTITFRQELQLSDVVSVYIQSSNSYRVGVELLDYSRDATVTLNNFGLMFTTQQNGNLLQLYTEAISAPIIAPGSLTINPSTPTGGIANYSRMWLSYDFISKDNSSEYDTNTWWYVTRQTTASFGISSSITTIYITDTSKFSVTRPLIYIFDGTHSLHFDIVSITNSTTLTIQAAPQSGDTAVSGTMASGATVKVEIADYENRFTEPINDVNTGAFIAGDIITVSVKPEDGISNNSLIYSTSVTEFARPIPTALLNTPPFSGSNILYQLDSNNEIINYTIPVNTSLSVSFVAGPGLEDSSQYIITWYLKDQITPISTGTTILASSTSVGQILSYTIQPYDGWTYGTIIQSPYIIIIGAS